MALAGPDLKLSTPRSLNAASALIRSWQFHCSHFAVPDRYSAIQPQACSGVWGMFVRGCLPRARTGTRPFATSSFSTEGRRSEEHTSELQSLMRISYAVFCLKKKNKNEKTQRK